jgi:hypothetical protein
MHSHCTFQRGDGEAPSKGLGRLGPSDIHGKIQCKNSNRTWLNFIQEYDLRNTPSLEESVRHSDVVYNLVGRTYPTKYG